MKYRRFKSLIEDHARLPIEIDRSEIDSELLNFVPQETKPKYVISLKLVSMIVSSLMILLVFTTLIIWEFTPTKMLTIDINPSFEISLNRFNRVVSVEAVSNDANEIVGKLSFWHRNPDFVMNNIYEVAIEAGYTETDMAMLISVDSEDETLVNKLSKQADKLEIKTMFMSANLSSTYVFTSQLMTKNESNNNSDFYFPIIESTAGLDNIPTYENPMDENDFYNQEYWTETSISLVANEYNITIGKLQLVIAIFDLYPEYDTLEEFENLIYSSVKTLIDLYENEE